ncbi:MAG: DNA polymerase IV [Elusimicrobiales bacterium]|nr:DNA polymerase IV [Elusimicrobiales bacterium]
MRERYIVHADMDAFFAAVEQRDNPALRGKPVVVGAEPKGGAGRGVVSTCSYEARAFGIRSAMPVSQAWRLCPHAVFISGNHANYGKISKQIYEIFSRFTPDIEPVSVDEAFLDITGSWKLFGKTPAQTCLRLKETVRAETGLVVSVGLAPCKMAAKIASDLKKPDGFVEVARKGLLAFLRPLDIGKISGLGPKAKAALNARGIKTIGELGLRRPEELNEMLGSSSGEYFWRLANGFDERPLSAEHETKSLSAETTFGKDLSDQAKLEAALLALSEKVAARLRKEGLRAAQIGLKVRLAGFETYTRAAPAREPTQYADDIYADAAALLRKFRRGGASVRLLGVRAGGLIAEEDDLRLFRPPGEEEKKALSAALDEIRKKYGFRAVIRARLKEAG